MAIKKVGDWAKVSSLINNLSEDFLKARDICLKRFGVKLEAIVRGHIFSQDLSWRPLSKAYKEQKVAEGHSENILVRTSTYYQAITSIQKADMIFVGIKRDEKTEDGEDLKNIAATHEFGSLSQNIQARPLWQPSFTEALDWNKKNNSPASVLLKLVKDKYKV
jgi:hypothetical protein